MKYKPPPPHDRLRHRAQPSKCIKGLHASAEVSTGGVHRRDRTSAYFILADFAKCRHCRSVGAVFHAKNIYNEIKSCDARARASARPQPFPRFAITIGEKFTVCDTQCDAPVQYCGNKDIWRRSSYVYGIFPLL
jgi:hypothetical protein